MRGALLAYHPDLLTWQLKRMQAGLASLSTNSEPLIGNLGALPSTNLTARKSDFNFNTVFIKLAPVS